MFLFLCCWRSLTWFPVFSSFMRSGTTPEKLHFVRNECSYKQIPMKHHESIFIIKISYVGRLDGPFYMISFDSFSMWTSAVALKAFYFKFPTPPTRSKEIKKHLDVSGTLWSTHLSWGDVAALLISSVPFRMWSPFPSLHKVCFCCV